MKKLSLFFLIPLFTAAASVVSIVDELGISPEEAKERLLKSIASGMINHTSEIKQRARALSVDMQVQGIRDLIRMAKNYSETEQFKDDYAKWRKQKLNPDEKTKLGLPRFGKMLENKMDNALDKKKNEEKYPTDPQALIKKRLEDFLAVSKTVDFNAEVRDGMFVKEEYEKKPAEWKMCYRAGREVVMAAREEARKWLDELN